MRLGFGLGAFLFFMLICTYLCGIINLIICVNAEFDRLCGVIKSQEAIPHAYRY